MSKLLICLVLFNFPLITLASVEGFHKGPVIANYGENTVIDGGLANPEEQHLKVLFDVSEQNNKGGINTSFNTAARFINMHARAGVPLQNIEVAIVVHGKAGFDLLNDKAHNGRFNQDNANDELLSSLLDAKVKIFICGQSASFLGITKSELNPRVEMSLSAMTSNALLQQQGYTLNPF